MKKKSQIVAFVYPDSVDVYRRIDCGHGRIVYKRVPVTVVPARPKTLGQLWASVWPTLLNLGVSLFGG